MEAFTKNKIFENPNFNVLLNRFYKILEYEFTSEYLANHLVIGGSVAESRQLEDGRTDFKDIDFITNSLELYKFLPKLDRVLPNIDRIEVQSTVRTMLYTEFGKTVEIWFKPDKFFETICIEGIDYEQLESINNERAKFFPTKLS